MNDVQSDVLEAVKLLPRITRTEAQELLPQHGRMAVSHALTTLAKNGRLNIIEKPTTAKRGRRTVQAFEPATQPPKKATVPEYQQLRREVEELRAWKADAIARFPDLAVPQIVLDARQIVAGETDGQLRDDVLAGRKDGCPIMRAVLKAMEIAR